MSKLHNMKLHDTVSLDTDPTNVMIMRVPGGWVYRFFERHSSYNDGQWVENYVVDSVFVDWSNEFNTNGEKK